MKPRLTTVFHINAKLDSGGGVEVYLAQLLPLQRERGVLAHWLAISRIERHPVIDCPDSGWRWRLCLAWVLWR